jgi:drug/metabolite transporter (DMT)-like permease
LSENIKFSTLTFSIIMIIDPNKQCLSPATPPPHYHSNCISSNSTSSDRHHHKPPTDGIMLSTFSTSSIMTPRILSFVALTAIAVTTQLAFKLSQNDSGEYEYNTQSAMTLVELIKLLLSITLWWNSSNSSSSTSRTTITAAESATTCSSWTMILRTQIQLFRRTMYHIPRRVYRHYSLLALSYGVYNQLIFAVMASSIDVGTFSLLKSTTPALVSALYWLVMGQPLTLAQTMCMIIQCFGIIPVVVSSSSSSSLNNNEGTSGGGVQLEFQLEDILLMLFCCGMASLNTVFNAVVIQHEVDVNIHVQNIVLYVYGVVINLLLYFLMDNSSNDDTNTSLSFWYGFGQARVLFLMLLNSFVGLAITMIYKYGDAVLKTLTQPCASSILVFLSYGMFGQSFDVIKAAGAGVVIVDTFLYLQLPSAAAAVVAVAPSSSSADPTKAADGSVSSASSSSLNRQKSGLVLAILFCVMAGVNYMALSPTMADVYFYPDATSPELSKSDSVTTYLRSVPNERHPAGSAGSAVVAPDAAVLAQGSSSHIDDDDSAAPLSIVLIIQALRLDDTTSTTAGDDDEAKQRQQRYRVAENQAKIQLLELYRSSFVDMYYESPQYVGRNDLDVACDDDVFGPIRTKCYSCVDQEIMAVDTASGQRKDEHRFACAAELFAIIEQNRRPASASASSSPRDNSNNKSAIQGYLVIHADFFLTPDFVRQARQVLLQHPASIWTAGGAHWDSALETRQAQWSPLEYTHLPLPQPQQWQWEEYGPKLTAARAQAAHLFPFLFSSSHSAVEGGGYTTSVTPPPPAPLLLLPAHIRSHWVDMYYVPAAISHRFAVFARLMKQHRIINEIAVIESLLLAGMDGRADGEYNFPCYGGCCTQVDATQLLNRTFLERYPCGQKIHLHDAPTRSALTSVWATTAGTVARRR